MFQMERSLYGGRGMVTVTRASVSKDISYARVYVSVFGVPDKAAVMALLESNSREIRFRLGQRVRQQLRIIPELTFVLDETLDYIENIDKLLKQCRSPSLLRKGTSGPKNPTSLSSSFPGSRWPAFWSVRRHSLSCSQSLTACSPISAAVSMPFMLMWRLLRPKGRLSPLQRNSWLRFVAWKVWNIFPRYAATWLCSPMMTVSL